jgi:hypothetical protein
VSDFTSVAKDSESVADADDLIQAMGNEGHTHALISQDANEIENAPGGLRFQGSRRLIEEEELRRTHHRSGHFDELSFRRIEERGLRAEIQFNV